MYQKHFALKTYPFDGHLHADELFACEPFLEAETRIRHLLDLRGIGLLTGEAGSGKTTLCRRLCDSLNGGLYRVAYTSMSTGSVIDTYAAIAEAFGRPAPQRRLAQWRAVRTEITRLNASQTPFLIFDEAHHLSNQALEELRLLTNYAMDSEKRLCMLLVGLPPLRKRLRMGIHESLNQRIVMRCHLAGLEAEHVGAYLEHRLGLAGAAVSLFEPAAIEALTTASGGMPRNIDRIAHMSLSQV